MAKHVRLSVGLGAALVTAVVTVLAFNSARIRKESSKEEFCRNQLRSLACAIDFYRQKYGCFPRNLTGTGSGSMTGILVAPEWFLICPGTGRKVSHAATLGAEDIDYIYIDWSRWFRSGNDVPQDCPLVYDRRLSNHAGRGINVVAVDKHAFWDRDAVWIRNFANKHPEYTIRLPEDR